KKINQHIQDDIEYNLAERKGGLWNQIKNIAFGDEEKDNGNASPDPEEPLKSKKESSNPDS
ncbi:MAG: phosphate acyltransferase, partial [Nitrospinae bacterium]|nr:phosphate acyltransferase [Nitrospinota bacterium]